jgi:D-aminoacyl-tRNA deacylase
MIVQRVKSAKVIDEDSKKVLGQIAKGLFILVGVEKNDTEMVAKKFTEKLLNLRIMSDENQKMNLSILDTKGEILAVSQFTLLANISKGNRPSFVDAAEPALAHAVYQKFIAELDKSGLKVQTGQFGAHMKINTVLDGPVTISF